MRTSIDIPDPLYKRMKVYAAENGLTLKELLLQSATKTVEASANGSGHSNEVDPWVEQYFGCMKDQAEVMDEMDRNIEKMFGQIDFEKWQ